MRLVDPRTVRRHVLNAPFRLPMPLQRIAAGTPIVRDGLTLDPQMQIVSTFLAKASKPPHGRPIDRIRGEYNAMATSIDRADPPMARRVETSIPGPAGRIPITILVPFGVSQLAPAVVYYHGGGFVLGSRKTVEGLCHRIADGTKAIVINVEYRLAPEHPFPAQIEDGLKTLRWLEKQGFPASRVALSGESAGAGLVLSTMLKLRDTGGALPVAAVVISPWVDLEARSRSFHENRHYDFVTQKALRAYTKRFVKKHEQRHPLAAPIHADLHGLPPILVQVGEVETLRDEGVELARKIEAAGGHVELEVWTDMIHAFHVFAPLLPPARRAIDRLTSFLVARFDAVA